MKRTSILFACLLSMLFNLAQAAETEPNGTKAQANTLALNGSNTGNISPAGDVDWWKVTTTGDGQLSLTLTSQAGKYLWVYLYDNDGTTLINSTYTAGTTTLNSDGLAAGTYFLKIVAYYAADIGGYTIANTLTVPAQANDAEPNGLKSQALVLPLNGNKTGHIGYYYNNVRDSIDWYKVTTNADGLLKLQLTSYNGKYVWVYLYDNNGTTLLNSTYTNASTDLLTDGLAAGTYYVRINCYYPSDFAPYKLVSSLTVPAQANDAEPNDTKLQSVTLAENSTNTGHVGYYYNNKRDTADWYKMTTSDDGLIKLSLTSANGSYVWVYLYDNDGTTLLNSTYTNASTDLLTDGLATGTYFVRINCYYTTNFAPYTLKDSLLPYTNMADAESNARPYQGSTLNANQDNPGHVGFYYKLKRDTADWWKINYTGTGALSVNLNLEPTKSAGARYTWLNVYKDTNAAPIFSSYTLNSLTASFTTLTQGYYYVRVRLYYDNQFESYTLTPTFTQSSIAKVQVSGKVIAPDCSSTNKLTLKCTGSKPPYTVQLYRYGIAYGDPKIIKNNAAFSYPDLPPGVYKATAYGDGATGSAFGSVSATFVPVPTALTVTNIQATSARLNWNTEPCVKYYQVQYRKVGASSWTTKKTNGNVAFLNATGLTAGTSYEWHVAPADSANGTTGLAPYSVLNTFATSASFIAGSAQRSMTTESSAVGIATYPNPANTHFTVMLKDSHLTGLASLWLRDMNGTAVWSRQNVQFNSIKGTQVDVSKLAAGIYLLQIVNDKGEITGTRQIVVSR